MQPPLPPGPDAPAPAPAPAPPPATAAARLHTRPWFWLAVAGAALLVLGTLLVLALVVGGVVGGAVAAARGPAQEPTTVGGPTGSAAGGEDADVFALLVGDCLTDAVPEGEVEEVPVVPCDQPHVTEAYSAHTIEAPSLPDEAAVETLVDEVCLPAFEVFVGVPYEESVLRVSYLSPTPASWEDGDRELLCLLEAPEGETLTGSARGTAR